MLLCTYTATSSFSIVRFMIAQRVHLVELLRFPFDKVIVCSGRCKRNGAADESTKAQAMMKWLPAECTSVWTLSWEALTLRRSENKMLIVEKKSWLELTYKLSRSSTWKEKKKKLLVWFFVIQLREQILALIKMWFLFVVFLFSSFSSYSGGIFSIQRYLFLGSWSGGRFTE